MAVTLPNPNLTGTIDADELEENFDALADKFGTIDDSDVKAGAGIQVSKLAASNYELVLSTRIQGYTDATLANAGLNSPTTTYFMVGGVPYDSANTTYTITAIETMTYAAGARTAAVYTLLYGTAAQLVAGTATSIKTGISTGAGAATFTGTQLASFTTSITTSSTEPKFFVLDVTTEGASWVETDSFAISIKLKKALRT